MRRAVIVLAVSALSACTGLECGLGTHEEDGECVPNIPTGCGPGTAYERGWCVVADVPPGPTGADAGPADEPRDGGD